MPLRREAETAWPRQDTRLAYAIVQVAQAGLRGQRTLGTQSAFSFTANFLPKLNVVDRCYVLKHFDSGDRQTRNNGFGDFHYSAFIQRQ